jgi:membrane-bound metal-dependent hydrolase YbcI (DUF457 family)
MFLFGHIGVTLGIFFVIGILAPRLKTIIDPKYLVIGALLPDLIDKPLGRVIFASTIANGRIIGHTLFFSIILFTISLYLYDKREDIRMLSLATGSFFHLIEDQMWNTPKTLFWPIFGLHFPKGNVNDTGLEYLWRELGNSFTLHFSQSAIPEIFGMVVIVVMTLNWLIKRFRQDKF